MVKNSSSKKPKKNKPQNALSANEKSKNKTFFDFLKFGESYTSLILGIIVVVVATILLLSFVKTKNIGRISQKQAETSQNETEKISLTDTSGSSELVKLTPLFSPTSESKVVAKAKPTKTIELTQISRKQIREKISSRTNSKGEQSNDKRYYTVKTGDNLWTIAQEEYNNGYNWTDIARANNLRNPGTIYNGNILIIPQVTQKFSTISISPIPTRPLLLPEKSNKINSSINLNRITGAQYAVVKGDNLWTISVRAYGDGYQWTKIAQANKLTNPGLIFSGNILKIPRNP